MKKFILDLVVVENEFINGSHFILKMTHNKPLPLMQPGQFVEIQIPHSTTSFLRRPISIHYVDTSKNQVWFLLQIKGEGTQLLSQSKVGDILNCILPLGNGFSVPAQFKRFSPLLVGGGVGTAPLLFLGAELKKIGIQPVFLLGARDQDSVLQLNRFNKLGTTYVTTEDGSFGEKGYVINHSVLIDSTFDMIYTCGPKAMMVAVASYAKKNRINCEVSLENHMACGVGACLCCVEPTKEGNLCVCKEGPVFNIEKLSWQI